MATKTADEIDEIEDDELEDDEDDDDPDAGKTDEELRSELKAVRDSLKKANDSSAVRRRKLREREAELAEARKPKAKPKGDDDDKIDVDEIRASALREGAAPAILRAKKAEAKSALLAAGVNPDRVVKATGLLKLDDLDLDDDGLDGVDEEIESLRKSWPELFVRPRKRRESTAGDNDDGSGKGRSTAKTASQLAADKLLGRS